MTDGFDAVTVWCAFRRFIAFRIFNRGIGQLGHINGCVLGCRNGRILQFLGKRNNRPGGKRFIHLQSIIACDWIRRRIQTRSDFANCVPVQCFYHLIGGIRDHATFICDRFRTRCVLRSLARVILPAAQVNVEIIHVATCTDAQK